jgi:hypothetical protein
MILTALLAPGAIVGSACATKPFNVKPRPVAPPAEFRARATAGTVEVRAGAIRDEDYLYSTFNGNLILAGVLPVKLSVKNGGAAPVDLKSVRFLLVASGQRQKPIEPRSAFKRMMKYYKIRLYNPEGYKSSLADFVSYGFDSRAPLLPGESRWGLLFFENPSGERVGSGIALSVKGLGSTDLKLNVY